MDELRAGRVAAADIATNNRMVEMPQWPASDRRRSGFPLRGLAIGVAVAAAAVALFALWPRTSAPIGGNTIARGGHLKGHAITPPRLHSGNRSAVLSDGVVALDVASRKVKSDVPLPKRLASWIGAALSDLSRPVAAMSVPPALDSPPGPVRSGAPQGTAPAMGRVRLVSPSAEVVVGSKVRFEWRQFSGAREYAVQMVTEGQPSRYQRHIQGRSCTASLPPGMTAWCRVWAYDAGGMSIASSRDVLVRALGSDEAKLVALHPDAHLLVGLVYERQGAFEQALQEYDKLTPTPQTAEAITQLKTRVRHALAGQRPQPENPR